MGRKTDRHSNNVDVPFLSVTVTRRELLESGPVDLESLELAYPPHHTPEFVLKNGWCPPPETLPDLPFQVRVSRQTWKLYIYTSLFFVFLFAAKKVGIFLFLFFWFAVKNENCLFFVCVGVGDAWY